MIFVIYIWISVSQHPNIKETWYSNVPPTLWQEFEYRISFVLLLTPAVATNVFSFYIYFVFDWLASRFVCFIVFDKKVGKQNIEIMSE